LHSFSLLDVPIEDDVVEILEGKERLVRQQQRDRQPRHPFPKSRGSTLQVTSGRDKKRPFSHLVVRDEDDEDDEDDNVVDRRKVISSRANEGFARYSDLKQPLYSIAEVKRSILPVSITTSSYFFNYLILTLSILFISLSTLFPLYTA